MRPLVQNFVGRNQRMMLYIMFGAVVGVLLIACVNVMNMQFARATLRHKELAVRNALGASRSRLVRQMLTENVLLAGCGAVAGVLLSLYAVDMFNAALAVQLPPPPSWVRFVIDPRVLAFTVGVAMLAAVGSGLAAGLPRLARQFRRRAQGRRPRQHQPHGQHPDPPACRQPDRPRMRASRPLDARHPLRHQPAADRLRLRHRRGADRPRRPVLHRRLPHRGGPPEVLRARPAAAAFHPGHRGGRRHLALSHDRRRQRRLRGRGRLLSRRARPPPGLVREHQRRLLRHARPEAPRRPRLHRG